MKKLLSLLLTALLVVCLTACASDQVQPASGSYNAASGSMEESYANTQNSSAAETRTSDKTEEEITMEQNTFYITIGTNVFSATFSDNAGAQALKNLLADGPMTIDMRDYGGFEKVGSLGQHLPTSNAEITTQAGDIVLYQGNQIVIFYGSNSWSYTSLGKVNDLSNWSDALGGENVTVTFSLSNT